MNKRQKLRRSVLEQVEIVYLLAESAEQRHLESNRALRLDYSAATATTAKVLPQVSQQLRRRTGAGPVRLRAAATVSRATFHWTRPGQRKRRRRHRHRRRSPQPPASNASGLPVLGQASAKVPQEHSPLLGADQASEPESGRQRDQILGHDRPAGNHPHCFLYIPLELRRSHNRVRHRRHNHQVGRLGPGAAHIRP